MGGGYRYEIPVADEDDDFDVHHRFRFHALRTPVSAMIRIPVTDDFRIVPNFGAGPEFLIAAQDRIRWDNDGPEDEDHPQEDWESLDHDFGTAASFVIGLDVETGLDDAHGVGTVGVRYVRQFVNFGPQTDDTDDEIRQSSLQFLATFTPMFIN